jgi:putative transferase (TIGR04331 family)
VSDTLLLSEIRNKRLPHQRLNASLNNLILSQVDDQFNPHTDLPLGPWCFIGAEHVYPDWHKLPFVDAPDSLDKMDAISRTSRWLANDLARKWGRKLNRRHGVDHGMDYWRFVLIAWLLSASQGQLLRFVHIQAFVAAHGNLNLNVSLAPLEPPLRPQGFMEFQHHQRKSHRFDFWATSLIIRRLAPSNWRLHEPRNPHSWEEFSHIPEPEEIVSNEHISRSGAVSRALFGRLSFGSVPGTKVSKLLFSLYLNLLPRHGKGNTYFSRETTECPEPLPEHFEDLLDEYLSATLPHAYDDQYPELERKASKIKTFPGRIFINNFMPSSELRRLEYASALEAGEKFVTTQHGSGYGIGRYHCWPVEFEFPYHAFLTWGWREYMNHPGNFVSLPSPWLSNVRNKHHEETPTLILVGTKTDIRGLRLGVPNALQWVKYSHMKPLFIDRLSPDVKENISYFSYSRGVCDLDIDEYLLKVYPNLDIQLGGLDKKILSSRLLIMDTPGTTLHISMAANVPTVCYWDPKSFPRIERSKRYFDALSDCGIFYETPEEAAAHVNAIWDDVGAWWNSPDVQKARVLWSNQYARSSKFWWWHWMIALARLQCEADSKPNAA